MSKLKRKSRGFPQDFLCFYWFVDRDPDILLIRIQSFNWVVFFIPYINQIFVIFWGITKRKAHVGWDQRSSKWECGHFEGPISLK